jgi:hypothetical protein
LFVICSSLYVPGSPTFTIFKIAKVGIESKYADKFTFGLKATLSIAIEVVFVPQEPESNLK